MAGKPEPSEEKKRESTTEEEEAAAAGQAKSSKMTEDLLTMVKKLQKEGSLEPQIKDLINRINELQQAKQTSNKELGESQAHREFLHGQLDSLNGEEEHLEEVLKKKQEALKILQEHWHKKKSKAQWLDGREQLEDLTGQHKDLWELQMLEQRLTQEIRALERSQENLQAERHLLRVRLQEVERSAWRLQGSPAGDSRAAASTPASRSSWSRRWSWP